MRVIAAAAAAVLLVGCGVSSETVPRPLPTEAVVPIQTASPAPSPPDNAEEEVTLWFVREGMLVPTRRTTDEEVDSQGLIDLLADGPTQEEAAVGLRTAVVSVVTGEPLVATAESKGVRVDDLPSGVEAVVLAPEFSDLLAPEQVLLLGEVVTTLSVGSVRAVQFVDEGGRPLGVPLPDGRLQNGPASPQDYAALAG